MCMIDKIKRAWREQRTYSKWTEPLPGTIKGETRLGRNQNRDMEQVVAGSEKDVFVFRNKMGLFSRNGELKRGFYRNAGKYLSFIIIGI